jgi:hypothetical protein
MSREVKGVSAYGLYEVDECETEPPTPGPDEPSWWPEIPTWYDLKKMAPWLINIGLGLGLVVAMGRK